MTDALGAAGAERSQPSAAGAARSASRPWSVALRTLLGLLELATRIASVIGRRPRSAADGYDVLLTGTFHSHNWIAAHVGPLADAARCRSVRMVSMAQGPPHPKVTYAPPPALLARALGQAAARLLAFTWIAVRTRPHVVGGFHLLLNGLFARPVGRLAGARAFYFCVGGATEIADGGGGGENPLFARLRGPDKAVEAGLLRAASGVDLVVTMGRGAAGWMRRHGVTSPIRVNGGGIDGARLAAGAAPPADPLDVLMVGRLAPIKRVDVFLRALARLPQRDRLRAALVGDGERRAELEALAAELGLTDHVQFAGRQADVGAWLRRARVLALTSDSEGLPLAVMEAMLAGVPAVVSDVGDLAELVEDGVNGYRVPPGDVDGFAERIGALLADPARRESFSRAAREAARRHEAGEARRRWDEVFAAWDQGRHGGGDA